MHTIFLIGVVIVMQAKCPGSIRRHLRVLYRPDHTRTLRISENYLVRGDWADV